MARTPSDRDASGLEMSAATRFFWCWLALSTSMSVCGNVAHALLSAPAGHRWMAATAALVPPIGIIAGTHSVSHLVRARAGGTVYWVALFATVLLALGAFVLSFDALRALAVLVGIRPSIAWIWPAVIDVSIAQATLCLLSLTRSPRPTAAAGSGTGRHGAIEQNPSAIDGTTTAADDVATGVTIAPPPRPTDGVPAASATQGWWEAAAALAESASTRPPAAACDSSAPPGDDAAPLDTAAVRRWQPVADSFVRDGVTPRTEPRVVATILAELEAGTRAATIEKRHNVHHSTVKKVLAAADQLTG